MARGGGKTMARKIGRKIDILRWAQEEMARQFTPESLTAGWCATCHESRTVGECDVMDTDEHGVSYACPECGERVDPEYVPF